MMKRWLTITLLALTACGSKKDSHDKDEAKPGSAASASGGSDSAAPAVAEADLFTGTTVTLPTPAQKLHFGMTEAEAKAAAPEVFAAKYGYEIPGTKVKYSSTKLAVQLSAKGNKVWNIRVELLASQDEAKGWLTKKWGPPVEQKNSIGTPEYFWTAPAAGLAAKLEQSATKSIVYFSQIMPLAQVLGTDPKHLGFETAPLIGMTKDEALKAFEAYAAAPRDTDPDDLLVQFLPTETGYSGIGSSLSLRLKQDKVTGYTFSFVAHDAKEVEQFAARLDSVYGKGAPDADQKMYTNYPGPPKAKAELRTDTGFSSTLWVGDYRK